MSDSADLQPVQKACLTVIMPVFNEQETVDQALGNVLNEDFVREVIVVDDGSTDRTPGVLGEIVDDRVKIVRHNQNRGKGSAVRTGLDLASSEFTVIQDADLEYNPRDIRRMVALLEEGTADFVYGSRFLTGENRRVLYFWHAVGNRLLTTLSNMVTNLNLTDMETCYKAGKTSLFRKLDLQEPRFGIEPEITVKIAARRYRLYEVSVSYAGRTYQEGKKIGWKDGVSAVRSILKHSAREMRTRRTQ